MNLNQIKTFVENYTNLNISERSRKRDIVDARAIYFYLARKHTNHSMQVISKSLNMDHTSVIHSIKNIAPVVLKINQSLANLCKNFKEIHSEALKNTTVSREELLEQNVRLKSELSTYKNNKLIQLVKDMPNDRISFVYDRVLLMKSLSDIGFEEDKTKVYEGY
jgi:L-cysteine desulfidase